MSRRRCGSAAMARSTSSSADSRASLDLRRHRKSRDVHGCHEHAFCAWSGASLRATRPRSAICAARLAGWWNIRRIRRTAARFRVVISAAELGASGAPAVALVLKEPAAQIWMGARSYYSRGQGRNCRPYPRLLDGLDDRGLVAHCDRTTWTKDAVLSRLGDQTMRLGERSGTGGREGCRTTPSSSTTTMASSYTDSAFFSVSMNRLRKSLSRA